MRFFLVIMAAGGGGGGGGGGECLWMQLILSSGSFKHDDGGHWSLVSGDGGHFRPHGMAKGGAGC